MHKKQLHFYPIAVEAFVTVGFLLHRCSYRNEVPFGVNYLGYQLHLSTLIQISCDCSLLGSIIEHIHVFLYSALGS